MNDKPLSWKPVRRGKVYCAPACGRQCTWQQYQSAKREAAKLAKRLGRAWKPYVWENLGWHWQVKSPKRGISVSPPHVDGGTYSACMAPGSYWRYGKTPEKAIAGVVSALKARIKELQTIVDKATVSK